MSDDFDFDDDFFADGDDDFSLDDLRDDEEDLGGFDNFDFDDADDFSASSDDEAGGVDSFDFGSDDDDDLFSDDGDDDDLGAFEDYDDDFFGNEPEREEGGTSRTFVYLAIAMLLFFLIGIGLVLFLVLRGDDDPNNDPAVIARNTEAAEILMTNAVVETQLAMTQTQTVLDQTLAVEQMTVDAQSTIEAANAQATATAEAEIQATADAQATLDALPTETPLVDLTAQAEIDALTQEAQLTLNAQNVTPTQMGTSDAVDADSVALTATALAQLLTSPTPSAGDVTPTRESGVPTIAPNSGSGGQLPETGLSVDISSNDLPLIALVAFGLIGVMFGARRLRSRNNQITKV